MFTQIQPRALLAALLLATASFGVCGSTMAQQIVEVGSVQAIDPDGLRQAIGSSEPAVLKLSDKVYMRDVVSTSKKGRVYVKFVDGSDLRLAEGSEVTIDEYVYDPQGGAGARGVVSVGRGVMRWASGKVQPDGMKFQTPTATMGIRGTEIALAVYRDGSMAVEVISGVVTLVPCGRSKGSDPYVAEKGMTLYVDLNCVVTTSIGAPGGSTAPGQAAAAAGSVGSVGGPSGGPGNGNGNEGNPGNGGGNTGGSGPGTGNGGSGNGNGGK
jgi:hypothetical protein